jgi:PadR family transcriptional regulator AphA
MKSALADSTATIGGRPLVPGEWAVLGLLSEAPAHGFALSKALAPGSEIGVIWSVSRQLVYRTLSVLEENELVHAIATEAGPGPERTIMNVTPLGRPAVAHWLEQPVAHVRDARSLLMLKLVFLKRSKRDVRPPLSASGPRPQAGGSRRSSYGDRSASMP